MAAFIVYTCPVGLLATQLTSYLSQSQQSYGTNAAHAYMPHCTLTGFFKDQKEAANIYTSALEQSLRRCSPKIPQPAVCIEHILFKPDWHGLVLSADWLKQVIQDFAQTVQSPTRTDALRLKDWLHLSLAYDFSPQHAAGLQQLAMELIDLSSPVSWELRFYQRASQNQWICHQSWPLTAE